LPLHCVALPCLPFGRSAATGQVNQTSHAIGRVELDTDGQKPEIGDAQMTGKIRTLRVDKGFGFIKGETGQEYFFHQSAIYGEGIADLREGDGVEFEVGDGPKGPRAENVKRTTT
jgi:cold shock protein